MHSYRKEVHHIRRTKSIFWLIVFIFAWLLYFFFQGYYPSINLSFESILSSTGQNRADLIENVASIKSFWIINVSALPSSASIELNQKAYASNEKRMSDYGAYSMEIRNPGYIGAKLEFLIAEEKPYFIEAIHLVPTGKYSIMSYSGSDWKPIGTDLYIARSASGTSLYQAPYFSGTLLTGFRGSRSIGEKYFMSGSIIMQLDGESLTFTRINHPLSSAIFACPNPLLEGSSLFCKDTKSITLESGQAMTGVIDHSTNWIKTASWIIYSRNGNTTKILNTKWKDLTSIFSYKNNWYAVESGSLLKIEWERKIPVKTPLRNIRYAWIWDGNIAIIGISNSWNTIAFFTPNSEQRPQLIPFPDVPLEGIRMNLYEGNIYITTKRNLFLIYRWSHSVEWLVEWDILATSDTSALYRKDGKIWRADFTWEE